MYTIAMGSQPIKLLVLPLYILYREKQIVTYMPIMYSIWKNKTLNYYHLNCNEFDISDLVA